MDEKLIDSFYKTIKPTQTSMFRFIDANGSKNKFHWENYQRGFLNNLEEAINQFDYLQNLDLYSAPTYEQSFEEKFSLELYKRIDYFTDRLLYFYEKIFQYISEGKPREKLTPLNLRWKELNTSIKSLSSFKYQLKEIIFSNFKKGNDIRRFIVLRLEFLIGWVENLGIEIMSSPLSDELVLLIDSFKNTITPDEAKIEAELGKIITEFGIHPTPIKSNKDSNFYPFINQGTIEKFDKYTKSFIIDPYIDYSYLFQRLKGKNLIHNISHRDFMLFLREKELISEQKLDLFLKKECFYTLRKSTTPTRENNFNLVFEI